MCLAHTSRALRQSFLVFAHCVLTSRPWFPVPQVIELYRLLAVGISLWNQFAVPVLFSVFWFVLFIVQLCSDTMSGNTSAGNQGIMFFLLKRCDVIMWIVQIIPLCVFVPDLIYKWYFVSNSVLSSLNFFNLPVSLNVVPHHTLFWV